MENFSGSTLLIVDDEPFLRDLLSARLKTFGAKILTAENGLAALDIMKTETVDVVLTDIDMPLMNGLELLAKMREMGMITPVVILTGVGDQSKTLTALRLGATDLLDKPFDSKMVSEVIAKALKVGETTRRIEAEATSSDSKGVSVEQLKKWKEALVPGIANAREDKVGSRKK